MARLGHRTPTECITYLHRCTGHEIFTDASSLRPITFLSSVATKRGSMMRVTVLMCSSFVTEAPKPDVVVSPGLSLRELTNGNVGSLR